MKRMIDGIFWASFALSCCGPASPLGGQEDEPATRDLIELVAGRQDGETARESPESGAGPEVTSLLNELQTLRAAEYQQREAMAVLKARIEALSQNPSRGQLKEEAFRANLLEERRKVPMRTLRQTIQGLADGMSLMSGNLERVERLANETEAVQDSTREELKQAMAQMEQAAESLMRAAEKLMAEAADHPDEESGELPRRRAELLLEHYFAGRQNAEDEPSVDHVAAEREARDVQATFAALLANQSAQADAARQQALELEKLARMQAVQAKQARDEAEKARLEAEHARQQSENNAEDGDRFQQLEQRLERIEKALEKLASDRGA